jgi:methyltransferase (TIGR00027 family)
MTQQLDPLDEVGSTARWTAAARALEREREAALLDDPWAERLAGEAGMAWLRQQRPDATLPMVLRTRFFDEWLGGCVGGGIRQAVLLGTGLDTRAWRLTWPEGFTVYELDRAAVLDAKAVALEAVGATEACHRVPVAADLAERWSGSLLTAGLDPTMPAIWLAEGLLFYLPDDLVRGVLRDVTRLSAAGSRLGFDIPNRAVLSSPYTRAWIEMQTAAGAPWLGTMDDPAAELGALGWRASVTQPGEGDTGHGRWTLPVIPATATDLPHSWYVTAVRTR